MLGPSSENGCMYPGWSRVEQRLAWFRTVSLSLVHSPLRCTHSSIMDRVPNIPDLTLA